MALPRRNLPPLNALRAFEVSGRRLSMRAAAEELGVTQGAVAQQVRALEEHLGITLFERRPRGLALTPAGASYLVEVSRALDTLAQATVQLRRRADVVTISVTPTVAAKLLIPRLGELREKHPDIELRTVATEALSDFARDQVDIAVRLPGAPLRADLESQVLFRQELVAVASPHLLKKLSLPLKLEQLRTLPLLHDALDQWPHFLGVNARLPGPPSTRPRWHWTQPWPARVWPCPAWPLWRPTFRPDGCCRSRPRCCAYSPTTCWYANAQRLRARR